MKLLIIMITLFSFNSYSDVKISIHNNVSGRDYEATFKTNIMANKWVASNVKNNSWGKKIDYTICGQATYDIDKCENVTTEFDAKRILLQKIRTLRIKLKTEDLTLKEINELLRR